MGRPLPIADRVDALHYESRALRSELRRSNERVVVARAAPPSNLQPHQQAILEQDWVPPGQPVVVESEDTVLSGEPVYEEMRAALLDFERRAHYNAPSKFRAFYSALRTLLCDVLMEPKLSERDVKLSAAHKWFGKHRPRGMGGDDPDLSAALAASLSISAAGPARTKAAAAEDDKSRKPFATQGTQHEFFSPYTGAAVEPPSARPSLTASLLSAVNTGRLQGQVGMAGTALGRPAQAAAAERHRVQPDMPLIQQPAVKREAGREVAAPSMHVPSPGNVSATGPVLAPKGRKARAVFDPDNLETPPGPAPNTQGKAPSWFQGPFRSVSQGLGPAASLPPARPLRADEEAEVAALRAKWAGMEDAAARGVVHAAGQVSAWADQRARLEEEIVRRQEASRYAAPAHRTHTATPSPVNSGLAAHHMSAGADYISAYAGVTVDMVGALASGVEALEHAPDALRAVPGLLPNPSTSAAAGAVREAAQVEYEREAYAIAVRTQQLGLAGRVRPEAMMAALAPVPDKSYLECVAKLPRPGSHLDSRPGSVKGTKAKGQAGAAKKKAGKKK